MDLRVRARARGARPRAGPRASGVRSATMAVRRPRPGWRPARAGRPGPRGCGPGGPARARWRGTRARWRSSRPGSASTTPARARAGRSRRTRPAATGPRSRAAGPAGHPQRQGEKIVRGAVMLPAEQEPVDVALADAGPSRRRRGAPGGQQSRWWWWCRVPVLS